MFKNLRRFIVKRILEKNLIRQLRILNILEEEKPQLVVDDETEFNISFYLVDNTKKLFDKINFDFSNKEEIKVEVIFKGTKKYEAIEFSVSKFLSLQPKTYIIKPRREDWLQKIDVGSGKIILSVCIAETTVSDLEHVLDSFMQWTTHELLERNIMKTTIVTADFGEKIYWITHELSKPIEKPETTVNFKQFCNLKNIF